MSKSEQSERISALIENGDIGAVKCFLNDNEIDGKDEAYDKIVRRAIAREKYKIVGELIEHQSYTALNQTIELAAIQRCHDIFDKLLNSYLEPEKKLKSEEDLMKCTNYLLMALNSGNGTSAEQFAEKIYEYGNTLLVTEKCNVNQVDKGSGNSSDNIRRAKIKLLEWQVKINPMHLLVHEENPFKAAIAYHQELRNSMKTDRTGKVEFTKLSEKCIEFAVSFLDCCEDENEIVTVFAACEKDILWTLTHDRFTDVITQANCQNWLYFKWLGKIASHWKTMSTFNRWLHIAKHVALFPYYSVCNAIKPPKARDNVAVNNFIYSAASYVCFLLLLLYTVFYDKIHGPHPVKSFIVTDYLVAMWIVAHFIQILTDFIIIGKTYTNFWWTWYQVAMVSFFLAAGISNLIANLSTSDSTQMLTWKMSAEGIYAFGITLAFVRILEWLHLSPKFGPVVVSLSKMTKIILRLLFIFIIVLLAFSFGMFKLYKDFRYTNVRNTTDVNRKQFPFSSYRSTLKVLFWVIFNYGDPDHVEIPSSYYWNQDESEVTKNFKLHFTMTIGYAMWAVFHIVFAILLLNMLIALLTNANDTIQGNSDSKWKLARTKLWLYYINEYHAVPPPFNILVCFTKIVAKFSQRECATKENNQDLEKTLEKLIVRYEERIYNPNTFDISGLESFVDMRKKIHCGDAPKQKSKVITCTNTDEESHAEEGSPLRGDDDCKVNMKINS